jgi:hypothetical protein
VATLAFGLALFHFAARELNAFLIAASAAALSAFTFASSAACAAVASARALSAATLADYSISLQLSNFSSSS